MSRKLLQIVFLCSFLITFSALSDKISNADWTQLKKQAINRKRQIIANTDGGDVFFPKNLKATKENFIKQRLVHSLGSKVDTISYNPGNSGFGYLTSRTKVGDQLLAAPKDKHNITGDLLQLGTDPLKIVEKFCRQNNFEFFVSIRCNDTHDMTHRKGNPHFLFPPYKSKHPEYLMGAYNKRPPHCNWSAVDFTHKEVRDYFLAIIEELMTNYEADGIELDFCRHLQYFKSVAWGQEASDEERKMMTDCMRKIRTMAENIGRRRGRPILIAVRLPDSAEYSRAVGLDVEKWMQEKLIDIYIGGFYMRLNPWEKSVKLCKKYGVKFYPSIDESRIRASRKFHRNSLKTDRARVAAALQAGVDGIYFFNYDYGGSYAFKYKMRGNMDDIRLDDKQYFISYRYRSPIAYLANSEKYNNLPGISAYTPKQIFPGEPQKYILEIGDDFNHPEIKETALASMTACVQTDAINGKRLIIKVNGQTLKRIKTDKTLSTFAVPVKLLKPGINEVELDALPVDNKVEDEIVILDGQKILKGKAQAPWRRLFPVHDFINSEKVVNGAYRITDSGTNKIANLLYPIGVVLGKNLKIRLQAKVENSSAPLAAAFRMADGHNIEIVTLQPNKIGLYYIGKSVPFKTTDRFHDYEASMKNGRFILNVDGKELFNEKLKMKADNTVGHLERTVYNIDHMNRQSFLFGSLAYNGTGTSLWKNIRMVDDGRGVRIKDLKFDLIFDRTQHLKKYRTMSPKWKFNYNVANGRMPAIKKMKKTYRNKDLVIVDGDNDTKVLRFIGSKGYDTITVNDEALTEKGSGILLAEWKVKYISSTVTKGCFLMGLNPMNSKKKTLYCVIVLYNNKIITPWGKVALAKPAKGRWLTFKIAIGVKNSTAVLWLNGKEIGAGAISVRKGAVPGIFFGDGSGNVDGKVELEYLKITTID